MAFFPSSARRALTFAVLAALARMLLMADAAFCEPLRILTEIDPPYNYTSDGTEEGDLLGLSAEIVREMQRRVGNASRIEVMPWARGYDMALRVPNVMLFSTTRTPRREALFKWAGPLVTSNQVFYAKRGSGIRIENLDDARKVRAIGVYKDDVGEQFLLEQGFGNLHRAPPATLPIMLRAGRVELWVAGSFEGAHGARAAGVDPGEFEVVFTIRETQLYCAFSRATPDETVARWQSALDAMKRDGTHESISNRWLRAR